MYSRRDILRTGLITGAALCLNPLDGISKIAPPERSSNIIGSYRASILFVGQYGARVKYLFDKVNRINRDGYRWDAFNDDDQWQQIVHENGKVTFVKSSAPIDSRPKVQSFELHGEAELVETLASIAKTDIVFIILNPANLVDRSLAEKIIPILDIRTVCFIPNEHAHGIKGCDLTITSDTETLTVGGLTSIMDFGFTHGWIGSDICDFWYTFNGVDMATLAAGIAFGSDGYRPAINNAVRSLVANGVSIEESRNASFYFYVKPLSDITEVLRATDIFYEIMHKQASLLCGASIEPCIPEMLCSAAGGLPQEDVRVIYIIAETCNQSPTTI